MSSCGGGGMSNRKSPHIETVKGLATKGMTAVEIASELGISVQGVYHLTRKYKLFPIKEGAFYYFQNNHDRIMERLKKENMSHISVSCGFARSALRAYLIKMNLEVPNPRGKKDKNWTGSLNWTEGKKTHLPPIKVNVKKLKVYPLPEAGQCKFYNDDMELCTNSIEKGSYCQEHNQICYTRGAKKCNKMII